MSLLLALKMFIPIVWALGNKFEDIDIHSPDWLIGWSRAHPLTQMNSHYCGSKVLSHLNRLKFQYFSFQTAAQKWHYHNFHNFKVLFLPHSMEISLIGLGL
jgi:hypothetical protein